MFQKMTFLSLSAFLALCFGANLASAQEKSTTTTTTVEAVTTKTPAPVKKAKPVHRSPAAKPVESTQVMSTTTTTEVVPPPPTKEVVHKVYDEEMLKKMSKTLCSDGFKAFVGTDKKNVCLGRATVPDIAYSCVWDKSGAAAFPANAQGPCNLDYTEHRGSIMIKKDTYRDNPPLGYGKEAQCCFRPAKGIETATR
jgi:hypothetical protein